MKNKPVFVTIVIILLAAWLLWDAQVMVAGIRQGLLVGAGILVPSLFPFMVLCGFVAMTDGGQGLSAPFGWLTEKWFGLPRALGGVILLGLVGGYPVGGRMIAQLLNQGRITQKTAERMLGFCVNAGPSFLYTAVGLGLFMDKKAGVILCATQIAATFLVGGLSARLCKERGKGKRVLPAAQSEAMPGAAAFVAAVTGAATAMLHLCAFAALFAGVLEMLRQIPMPQTAYTIVAGFLEVTSGCIAAGQIGGAAGFGLASLFISFGGVSVLFQVFSFFSGRPVKILPFLAVRLVHGCLATAMAVPLFRLFMVSGVRPVWASADIPRMVADNRTVATSLCLLGLCTILVASATEKWDKRGNLGEK